MRPDWANYASLPLFFGFKVFCGLLILKVSAVALSVAGFSVFSQFLLFSSLLNLVAVGGAQNGLIQQVSVAADDDEVARVQSAAIAIWLAAIVLIGLPVVLARGWVAVLLVGDATFGWAVPPIVALILLGGVGQIFCSVLTGRDRAAASLFAQGIGLLVGVCGCLAALTHGKAELAAIAFSAGPPVTAACAYGLVRSHRLSFHRPTRLAAQIRKLLGFSGAYVAVALFTSIAFFVVRFVYREAFGLDALGYWLVANRISDTSVQLMGLFALQLFLPRYARTTDAAARTRVLRNSWVALTGAILSLVLVFSLAPAFFVRVLLSEKFVPAVSGILVYMVGDALRATVMIGMHEALGRGRLKRYMFIEMCASGLFAVFTVSLIAMGDRRAPFLGYTAAYAIVAAALLVSALRARHRGAGGSAVAEARASGL